MKNFWQYLLVIIISLISSFSIQASPITNTFSAGDTLTAVKMTEIKDAVTDNDTRITTNASEIDSLLGGDGSAGNLVISANTNWTATPPVNPFFNNITIEAGQTLTVPAGTMILCSGSFVNNGTLVVTTGAVGNGTDFLAASPSSSGPRFSAHPGDSYGAATLGEFGNNGVADPTTLRGGRGGFGIPQPVAKISFGQFRIGGGAGAGAVAGGVGGGLVKIYCNGTITNNSNINANGENGGGSIGGGGGGIVILASNTVVDNTAGIISVTGGSGGNDSSISGASGGGGGGIVIMMSPSAPIPGTTVVTGGTAGTNLNTQTSKGRLAGSGGGASGGNGGDGGSTFGGGTNNAASGGANGYVITTTGNPLYLAR